MTCHRRQVWTTRVRTRSCARGSTRTGNAWTTWTGFAGPKASSARTAAATMAGGSRICAGCDRRVSATAGTIFSRHPHTDGMVQRGLALVNMLNRHLGHAVAPRGRVGPDPDRLDDAAPLPVGDGAAGRDRLRCDVEVDESFLGGPEPGVPPEHSGRCCSRALTCRGGQQRVNSRQIIAMLAGGQRLGALRRDDQLTPLGTAIPGRLRQRGYDDDLDSMTTPRLNRRAPLCPLRHHRRRHFYRHLTRRSTPVGPARRSGRLDWSPSAPEFHRVLTSACRRARATSRRRPA